ncbi:MAG: c-type cytochrome [Steroidobacteraceae bacterium]
MRVTFLLCILFAALPPVMAQAPSGNQEFNEAARMQPDLARGAELFRVCVACHGPGGGGTPEGDVPAIAGQHARVIVRQLVDYRHADRWDVRMEEVAGTHNLRQLRDLADVAGWVSRLPVERAPGLGDGSNASAGRTAYQASCAGCHGADGEGNGALLVPRVAGQHYRYLLRQLHDTLEGRRPNMPPPHADLLVGMDVNELTGLADYLSRLRPARQLAR